jgi:membrane-associated phospholipid phosphatase
MAVGPTTIGELLERRQDRVSSGSGVPVLEARRKGPAERFARALEGRHPMTVFLAAAIVGYAALATVTIAAGLLLTHVILRIDSVARADERVVTWLVAHRTATRTEASLTGSIMAGGVVLPLVVGIACLVLVCFKRWRVAAFLLTAIAVEAATYRLTVAVVHRHRPRVARLEHLPVDASFYSGHTAASIAVYCGLALLATSVIRRTWFRVCVWTFVLAVPLFVAGARMYRGMHHPLDSLAGVVVGVACLLVAVFAARAAGVAVERRRLRARGVRP